MIDFTSLRKDPEGEQDLDPTEIFRSLPKPQNVNDLWDTQAAALRAWNDRRTDHDVVIKLNTGSGKTLVGLLIGESVRRELRLPVLYLAPTRQLVDQVVANALSFGISAVPYDGLPPAFLNAEALLVATYHALFNGRSVFGVLGAKEPVALGGVILDDAHTSSSILRDIFSIVVDREYDPELYRDVAGRFRRAFERVHMLGRFDDMLAGREEGVLEVPYWAWHAEANAVRERIQEVPDDRFRFSLPLVRDHFEFCHALVSRDSFVVTPILPLVHLMPSFADCARRIFMSATLADDGVLVRTFGADPDSVGRPITTRSVAGLGERMIVAPTLSGLSRSEAVDASKQACDKVRERGQGAAVIVPSEAQAADWADVGKICIQDAVAEAVAELNNPATRSNVLPILVNRYDGIDLPQDACRVLILDGKPRGANLYDLYRATVLQGLSSINITLAQRVEQGMGRGNRGAGDYCVVLLLGKDLVEWLGRRDAQRVLTPGTRAQVELGWEMASHLATRQQLLTTIDQCLNRDEEWKQVHAERIAAAEDLDVDTAALVAAGRVERRAFEMLLYQRYMEASDFLRKEAKKEERDNAFQAWLLQLAARAALHGGDEEGANRIQAEAHAIHRGLLKPLGEIQYRRILPTTPQAGQVIELIEQYAIRSAVLEAIDNELSDLHADASVNRFEEAIHSLGRFLGLESERPENSTGSGPDNVWLDVSEVGLVIECKHQKASPVNKDDHGQLRVSMEWFNRHYEGWAGIPLFVHPDGVATENSELVESATRCMTFEDLRRLKVALKEMYKELAFLTASRSDLEPKAAELLARLELEPRLLVGKFTRSFSGKA